MKKQTIQNKQEIIDIYEKTGSTAETAKLLNITQARVQYVTKKAGVLKNMSNSRRKYSINEHYFDCIDNEHKAYWLGFLFADGSLNYENGTPRLQFTLAGKDVDAVKQLALDLDSNAPVIVRNKKSGKFVGTSFATFSVRSKLLCDTLESHGCVRRKSMIMQFPVSVPKDLLNHFIRGYFDGNGSVFISKEKHWRKGTIMDVIHFRFVGTENIMNKIQEILQLGGSICIAHKDGCPNIKELSYKHRKKAKLFYSYLYHNATIWLERKRIVFENHLKKDVQRL